MKNIKPIINSLRNTVLIDYKKKLFSNVKKYPKKMFIKLKSNSGRNNQGKITIRNRGGGHKKKYRIVDFKRYNNDGNIGTIKSIEYDPYRSSFISFVSYLNGIKTFIISSNKLKIGDKIISGSEENIPIKEGNNLPLKFIPPGIPIHNIETKPLKGAQLVRSAGASAKIIGIDSDDRYVLIELPSKEVKRIFSKCRATIGRVSNEESNLVKLGKAGRNIQRGFRPKNRGVSMNAIDHPHGGGEGKSPIGKKSPYSPWGKKTLGKKTRKKNKPSNKYIAKYRYQAK